jgi:hypothetical protein
MPKKPPPTPDDPEESKRFIDTAREVEASDDMKDFELAFKRVVHSAGKQPPKK